MSNSDAKAIDNMRPRIAIIGGGISGLALAVRLRATDTPFKLYRGDKDKTSGYNYGIEMLKGPYEIYSGNTNINRVINRRLEFARIWHDFQSRTDVNRLGRARTDGPFIIRRREGSISSFYGIDRDVRGELLQQYLHGELGNDLVNDEKLIDIKSVSQSSETGPQGAAELVFESGLTETADIVVDAAGLNGSVSKILGNSSHESLLPYVTYQGARRMTFDEYQQAYQKVDEVLSQSGEVGIQIHEENVFFQIKKSHYEKDKVELRWVYSRPPTGEGDALHKPNRSKTDAKVIPNELIPEITEVIKRMPPGEEFELLQTIFNTENMAADRILNWHLRLRFPTFDQMKSAMLGNKYRVISIGDAAHSLPILKSKGANTALIDATTLSTLLSKPDLSDADFTLWLEKAYDKWFTLITAHLQLLREKHGQACLTQDELRETIGFWREVIPGRRARSPTRMTDREFLASDDSESESEETMKNKI